jgi:CTP synthase
MIHEYGKKNVLSVHLTLIPEVSGGELKTKPTQHSVKSMLEIGIQPDVLLCRSPRLIDAEMRRKIALFTNVEFESVISAYDIKTTIYEIPLIYQQQKMDEIVLRKLDLPVGDSDMSAWQGIVELHGTTTQKVRIAFVGKYTDLADSYKSVDEALYHGGFANGVKVELVKIDSEKLEKEQKPEALFENIDGILVPGGFGSRGIPGMVMAARWARENKIPYFGICLGLQVMVIEFSRNVLGLEEADSTEFSPACVNPVVILLEEQINVKNYGGTMRLGRSETRLLEGYLPRETYGTDTIFERHRHRYEVSNKYRDQLEQAGFKIAGLTPDGELVECMQWADHPWGIGVQFHPEFLSKPVQAHPLFRSFIGAAKAHAYPPVP